MDTETHKHINIHTYPRMHTGGPCGGLSLHSKHVIEVNTIPKSFFLPPTERSFQTMETSSASRSAARLTTWWTRTAATPSLCPSWRYTTTTSTTSWKTRPPTPSSQSEWAALLPIWQLIFFAVSVQFLLCQHNFCRVSNFSLSFFLSSSSSSFF